jgi:hypothetical protein
MIIFEPILTTIIARIAALFRWGSSKNWLELKIEPQKSKLSLPKSVKHTVEINQKRHVGCRGEEAE